MEGMGEVIDCPFLTFIVPEKACQTQHREFLPRSLLYGSENRKVDVGTTRVCGTVPKKAEDAVGFTDIFRTRTSANRGVSEGTEGRRNDARSSVYGTLVTRARIGRWRAEI